MPAYLVPIGKPICRRAGCRRRATHRLFNARNAALGAYCEKHGEAAKDIYNR